MNIPGFFRSRQWAISRRIVMLGLIAFLAYRTWGGSLFSALQSANAARDIVITKSEFRPDIPGAKPAWIIGLRNNSHRFAYDLIQLDATYLDSKGAVLQHDSMTLHQKLMPGQEEIVGSSDYRDRPGAVSGTLKIVKATVLK
jgi:hypothetical protein